MKNLAKLMLCLTLFSIPIRMGFSRGDKIIPQVVAGPGWTTKFDLTNISPAQAITNMRLAFYHNDGTSWMLQTKNQGTISSYTLNLQPRQTLRVEAIGSSTLEAGYAVIYDEETGNSDYSVDYVLGISVFYQVLTDAGVTETVTVSVPQPTATATAPMEMNAPDIASGLAIVNWAGVSNAVQLDLYSEDGTFYKTATFDLAAGEQRAEFLDQKLFPGLTSFKGMAEFSAKGPIALLALRQTRAADGNPQYATLIPVDKESLRRNTYMVLLQASTDANPSMPLDVDGLAVDFYRNSDEIEAWSWDLEYQYGAPDTTIRYFHPDNFASIASLGYKSDGDFDALSLPTLKAISTYSTSDIDLSGTNLYLNLTFAVHTDLGNYAKARIVRIIDTTDGVNNYKDLVLEVVVYK